MHQRSKHPNLRWLYMMILIKAFLTSHLQWIIPISIKFKLLRFSALHIIFLRMQGFHRCQHATKYIHHFPKYFDRCILQCNTHQEVVNCSIFFSISLSSDYLVSDNSGRNGVETRKMSGNRDQRFDNAVLQSPEAETKSFRGKRKKKCERRKGLTKRENRPPCHRVRMMRKQIWQIKNSECCPNSKSIRDQNLNVIV